MRRPHEKRPSRRRRGVALLSLLCFHLFLQLSAAQPTSTRSRYSTSRRRETSAGPGSFVPTSTLIPESVRNFDSGFLNVEQTRQKLTEVAAHNAMVTREQLRAEGDDTMEQLLENFRQWIPGDLHMRDFRDAYSGELLEQGRVVLRVDSLLGFGNAGVVFQVSVVQLPGGEVVPIHSDALVRSEEMTDLLMATLWSYTPERLGKMFKTFSARRLVELLEPSHPKRLRDLVDGNDAHRLGQLVQGQSSLREVGVLLNTQKPHKLWELLKTYDLKGVEDAVFSVSSGTRSWEVPLQMAVKIPYCTLSDSESVEQQKADRRGFEDGELLVLKNLPRRKYKTAKEIMEKNRWVVPLFTGKVEADSPEGGGSSYTFLDSALFYDVMVSDLEVFVEVGGVDVGPDLQRRSLDMKTKLFVARRLVLSLARLHENGIVHYDIKPSNLAVSNDGEVMLADFGLTGFDRQVRVSEALTLPFADPEYVFEARPHHFTKKYDAWCLGHSIYWLFSETAMAYNMHLVEDEDIGDHLVDVYRARRSMLDLFILRERGVPMEWIRLIAGLLHPRRSQRLEPEEAVARFRSLFVRNSESRSSAGPPPSTRQRSTGDDARRVWAGGPSVSGASAYSSRRSIRSGSSLATSAVSSRGAGSRGATTRGGTSTSRSTRRRSTRRTSSRRFLDSRRSGSGRTTTSSSKSSGWRNLFGFFKSNNDKEAEASPPRSSGSRSSRRTSDRGFKDRDDH